MALGRHAVSRDNLTSSDNPMADTNALSSDGLPWESVEDFYRQMRGGLVVRLFYLLSSRQDAEDVVHDAFIRAAQKWHLLRNGHVESVTSWLNHIAVNLALNKLRQRTRRREVALEELADYAVIRDQVSVSVSPDRAYDLLIAFDVLQGLSDRQREAYLLRHYFGFDIEDIADHLKRSPSTIRVHLYRAQEAITRKLGRFGGPSAAQARRDGLEVEGR